MRMDMLKRIMKKFLFLSILMLLLVGCSDENEGSYAVCVIHKVLPIYWESADTNTLVSYDENTYSNIVLNSMAEVETALEPAFLEAYPEYLNVDYQQYSLIVHTISLDSYFVFKDVQFLYQEEADLFYFHLITDTDEKLRGQSNNIIRIAICVDKIPSDTYIEDINTTTLHATS